MCIPTADVINRASHFAGNTLCVTAAVFFFARLQLCERCEPWFCCMGWLCRMLELWNDIPGPLYVEMWWAPSTLYLYTASCSLCETWVANFVDQDLFWLRDNFGTGQSPASTLKPSNFRTVAFWSWQKAWTLNLVQLWVWSPWLNSNFGWLFEAGISSLISKRHFLARSPWVGFAE